MSSRISCGASLFSDRLLEIEAAIGRNIMQGETPFAKIPGNKYRLAYWGENSHGNQAGEALYEIYLCPDNQCIDVTATHGSAYQFSASINLPSAIVGFGLSDEHNEGARYRGLFWCLTPGERQGNLYDVVNLIANTIVMAKHGLIPSAPTNALTDDQQDNDVGMR